MTLIALLLLTLVAGGSAYEIAEGATFHVETGSYRVEVEHREKARIWLPEGSYSVTLRVLDLRRDLAGVVVILANKSAVAHEISMTEAGLNVREGFNLKVDITLAGIANCEISNITFWRGSYYGGELGQMLRALVSVQSTGDACRLTVDTRSALPGFFYVTADRWATLTLSGPGYVVAVAYGVWRGQVKEGVTTTPARGGGLAETILPETPVPLDVSKRGLYGEMEISYRVLLGLSLTLIFVAVVEYVSAKRGY